MRTRVPLLDRVGKRHALNPRYARHLEGIWNYRMLLKFVNGRSVEEQGRLSLNSDNPIMLHATANVTGYSNMGLLAFFNCTCVENRVCFVRPFATIGLVRYRVVDCRLGSRVLVRVSRYFFMCMGEMKRDGW
jgi:hypothetical protein